MATLRKHAVAPAGEGGNDTDSLEAALKEVPELGSQKVLPAIFIAAQVLNAAGAARTEEKSRDDPVHSLFEIVLLKVERALERFANGELKWGVRSPAGDPQWGRQAAEGAAAIMATVVALRERAGGCVPLESAKRRGGCYSGTPTERLQRITPRPTWPNPSEPSTRLTGVLPHRPSRCCARSHEKLSQSLAAKNKAGENRP